MASKPAPPRRRPTGRTSKIQRVVAPPSPGYPMPRPAAPPPGYRPRPRRRKSSLTPLLLLIGVPLIVLVGATAFIGLAALLIYGGGDILPGVRVGGMALGGRSADEAAALLASEWTRISLTDGERAFSADPAALGIMLDAPASAEQAARYGRSEGGLTGALRAVFGGVDLPPVINVDTEAMTAALNSMVPQIDVPPVNAGIQFVNGQVQAREARDGRLLDVAATAAALRDDPAASLADGQIDLVMMPVAPEFRDAAPLVQAAQSLLTAPLRIRAYDPIRNETMEWMIPTEIWGSWLTGTADETAPLGLRLTLDEAALRGELDARQAELGEGRFLATEEAAAQVQDAVARAQTDVGVRVYHRDRQHVVQAGETIISIAWDYGIPYPYVQQANAGVETLSVGQTITIPSPDVMLPLPVVEGKRIVVSISEQRTRVYENGALLWDWPSSTGINSSPTWKGIYQVISHEPNAYAGNWNLWMPNFIGVYRPVPGAEFTNGFHGFPTRGGSQLLWTNSLGTRVTYGCILLHDDNVRLLYDWAQEGVVVEITG